ncbi:DUF2155 domain-containing protein [Paracoccus alkenifer]|uniref:DUF2155 domain-containing protein n=1 Tax=Paracoccus alkenifer TaxID=65735 RepID=A0A1H6KV79_9RHOB|nr:DUF2155 domain-containing protein [Paracoccus alkenifer]SEH79646.1 hypothetical protein SAMN04488075_1110 [Paracoccus alkenifer]
MIRPALMVALAVAAAPAWSQVPPVRPSTDIAPGTRAESVSPLVQGQVTRANAALLRGLDKVSGQSTDLPLLVGDSLVFGRLEVRLGECRYPAADPDSDAFAQLTITDTHSRRTLFTGWMIASSPALSALDDSRYDIWVVTCDDGSGLALPDLTYEPDTAEPEGGEGMDPDGETTPVEDDDDG